MKVLVCIISAMIFITGVCLSGCTENTAVKSDIEKLFPDPHYSWGNMTGQTITVWGDKDDLQRTYLVKAFDRYEQLTGNRIETKALSKEDIDKTVPDAFQSETAKRPDLLLGYGGANIVNLNPDENFYDFTDAPWIDDLTDISLNQTIYNGKVMGLPCGEASISGMIYNKQIFKKYGIDIPKTQEEFLAACQTLKENGITPVYLPYAEITMLLYQFPLDSMVTDTATLNALNSGSLSYSDMPEMKKVVNWYKDMADKGYFGENYQQNNWNGMDNAMKNQEYAMMICWDTWLYSNFTGDPSVFGLMPAFMGVPENGCFEGPNILMLLANQKSPNLDVALDLINFMADPYNYNYAYEGIYTAPIFNNQVGSVTTPQYVEAERLIDKHFYNSTAWLRIVGFSQIDAAHIQRYMQGEITLEECLLGMDADRLKRAQKK